ncbi:MAG: metallophosphoesterase [Chloroflexota bacterium]
MDKAILRFVHISDTHYSPQSYDPPPSRLHPRECTHMLIEQVNALPFTPDLILHTGDVAYDPHPEIYPEARDLFTTLKAPVVYVPGNHDHSAAMQDVLMGRSPEDITQPLYHTQAFNDVRFIFLDANSADIPPPAGEVSQAQLAWLAQQLDAHDPRPIVVAIHHPLMKTQFSAWYDEFMMTINGDAVHDLLKTAVDRVRGVFFGHVHQNITFYRDGIMYSGVNSSWTQFYTLPDQGMETRNDLNADPAFNVVTLTDEGTIVQRYTYRVDAD